MDKADAENILDENPPHSQPPPAPVSNSLISPENGKGIIATIMDISPSEYSELNEALLNLNDILYKPNPPYSPKIVETINRLCNEAESSPQNFDNTFDMDRALTGVEKYLHATYPWLTQRAVWALRTHCLMAWK